jgi:hypothetical protein
MTKPKWNHQKKQISTNCILQISTDDKLFCADQTPLRYGGPRTTAVDIGGKPTYGNELYIKDLTKPSPL